MSVSASPLRAILDAQMSEKALQAAVMKCARLAGFLAFHVWRSDHSPEGFPDCVLAKPGRLIFAELKKQNGKLTPAQEEWGRVLTAGIIVQWEYYVWRPSDWSSGQIQRILGLEA